MKNHFNRRAAGDKPPSSKEAESQKAAGLQKVAGRVSPLLINGLKIIEEASDILSTPQMQQTKQHVQHGEVSVYSHSVAVAAYSYTFARKMRLKVDERSLVRGALLHDFFLYDWHDDWDKLHGFKHPRIALENADKHFSLNRRERDIIRKHMWPMTFINIPKYKEAWLVCFVDKYVSLLETFKILRYNYD